MGRRSINTTKSGKYMNPTDQARKEARKRELKKNKKQRMAVRAAVLKNKDPVGLLQDLEALDELELNPEVKTDLNEKVIKDKRKKIKETFERVLKLYSREEPERFNDFKTAERRYEKQRAAKVKDYEAIRDARQVTVDSIPLPEAPNAVSAIPLPQDIPLPGAQPPSILKKSSSYGPPLMPPPFMVNIPPSLPSLTWPYCLPNGKKPPGPPPGLPPGVAVAPPGPPVGLPPHIAAAHQMEQLLRAEEDARLSSDDEDDDMHEEEEEEMEGRKRERGNDSDEMETDDSEREDEESERQGRMERGVDEGDSDSDTDDSMRDEREAERSERRRRRDEERRERRTRRGSDDDDQDDDDYRRRRRRRHSSSEDEESLREREKRSVRFADDESEGTSDFNLSRQLPAGMTALQARMLAMAGQQIPMSAAKDAEDDDEDEDGDDEEETERRKEREEDEEEEDEEEKREKVLENITDAQLASLRQAVALASSTSKGETPTSSAPGGIVLPQTGPPGPPARPPPGPPPSAPPGFPPGMPLPPNFARPPLLRPPPPPLRMIPPGPPGGRPPAPPPGPPPGVPHLLRGGPPPRLPLPPGLLPPPRLPMPPPRMGLPRMENPNVFTAAPMIRRLPAKADEVADVKSSATIEAKPQIRNLTADVTRFMPTSLRVKRDAKGKTKGLKAGGVEEAVVAPANKPTPAVQTAIKDDAYDQFMKEMGDLM